MKTAQTSTADEWILQKFLRLSIPCNYVVIFTKTAYCLYMRSLFTVKQTTNSQKMSTKKGDMNKDMQNYQNNHREVRDEMACPFWCGGGHDCGFCKHRISWCMFDYLMLWLSVWEWGGSLPTCPTPHCSHTHVHLSRHPIQITFSLVSIQACPLPVPLHLYK